MRAIKRTFTVTHITAQRVRVINNNVVVENLGMISTMDNVTDANAAKVFTKHCPTVAKGDNVVVVNVEAVKETYAMRGEDFIKYAKRVENETAPQEV
nr:MAG TPA: Histone-like Protein p6 [Caudoviricetes sp.]